MISTISKFSKFIDIPVNVSGKVLLIDIDGTLTPDNETSFDPKIFKHLQDLSARNKIYLCSNTRNLLRRDKLSKIFSYKLIGSKYKKPWKNLLSEIPSDDRSGPFVVVGDKFLTDYLFARVINSEFILIDKVVSGRERWRIKLLDLIDNFFKKIFFQFL